MIKWKDGNATLVYRTDNEETSQTDVYLIDLTNHRFFLEEEELEWTKEVTEHVRETKPDCVRYLCERIQNNRNVMYSMHQVGNQFEYDKAARHMAQNQELLTFIEAYEA